MPIKGTYYNATLGAAPTTLAHIGGIAFTTINSGAVLGTNVYASNQINILGIYLINWCLTTSFTSAFNDFLTDIKKTTGPGLTTPSASSGAYWGKADSGSGYTSSSGSLITQVTTTDKYYNLTLAYAGGGTVGTVSGFYCITRLG